MEEMDMLIYDYFNVPVYCDECGEEKLNTMSEMNRIGWGVTIRISIDFGLMCPKCDAGILRKRTEAAVSDIKKWAIELGRGHE